MAGETKTTTDHREIRRWVEERGGRPVEIKGTGAGKEVGVLRIEYPGAGDEGERLDAISWDEFFRKFEESRLAFVYQEETAEDHPSRFSRLVRRDPP